MKKLFYYIILFTFFSYEANAQNLVPNFSFEEHNICYISFRSVNDWYTPTACNPEYFNACDTFIYESVPMNFRGYQFAKSGNAYIFFATNITTANDYREHVSVKLNSSLLSNKKYCVKFYVSLAETGYFAMDDIGAYFSIGNIDTTGMGTYLINYNPQISNPRGNIIMDTTNWVLIEGSFIAQGGEDHITIGSFMPVDSIAYRVSYGGPTNWAGYFVDDMSVYECDNPDMPADAGNNRTICPGDSVQLGSTNYEYYRYIWYPKTGLSDTTSGTPFARPLVTTTYYLQQTNFLDTLTTDSVTVFVNDCSAADAGENKSICKGDSIQIGSGNYSYNRYSWHPRRGLNDSISGTPWAKPINTTTYYLTQSNFADSVTRDSITISIINCDTTQENYLIIYPNPCNDNLYVEFSQYVPSDTKVYISNAIGQVMIIEAITPNEKKKYLNTASLAEGIYFCYVYSGTEMIECVKIVKFNR